jgi:hypothetical protein
MATTKIPKTETPDDIIAILLLMAIGMSIILVSLIGIIFSSFLIGICVGLFISFLVIGYNTALFSKSNVPPFHTLILINTFTGKMRVIFPGVNWKLPWEKPQDKGLIDLRVDLKEVCEETYDSKNGARMETKYVYTIKPDYSNDSNGSPEEKILCFASFEQSAIKTKGRALFSMLLSDYYGKNEGNALLNKSIINEAVFGTESSPNPFILDFEKKHAVEVSVRLEDSDWDAQTLKYRETVAGAESLAEAIEKLTAKGVSQEQAEKFAKLLNFKEGYKEEDFNLNIAAPDLKNLTNVSIMNPLGGKGTKK